MKTKNSEIKRILVVDDTKKELEHALLYVTSQGYEANGVSNLADALDALPEHDAVLTDMFFPAGDMDQTHLVDRFSKEYQKYFDKVVESGFFNEYTYDSRKIQAIKVVAGLVGVRYVRNLESVQEFCKQYLMPLAQQYHEKKALAEMKNCLTKDPRFDEKESLVKVRYEMLEHTLNNYESEASLIQDIISGRENNKKYQDLVDAVKGVQEGRITPYGIVVCEKAVELGKPVQVVTSMDHHSAYVDPVLTIMRSDLKIRDPVDTLNDETDLKNWETGLKELLD